MVRTKSSHETRNTNIIELLSPKLADNGGANGGAFRTERDAVFGDLQFAMRFPRLCDLLPEFSPQKQAAQHGGGAGYGT